MNILVYDVAAENGGATSILEYYYNIHKQDDCNHYYYVLSTFRLENTENISVINVPEVKKSWFHRLWFDSYGVRKYIKELEIDSVLSLQNTVIPCFHGNQTVYVHNALPFSDYRFSFIENKKMWIYQNIIGRFILGSIRKADRVIVQTEWMKKAIASSVHGSESKTVVQFPRVSIPDGFAYERKKACTFFYPANSAPFKNHKVIFEACARLKDENISDYEVVFTLHGDETKELEKYRLAAEKDGIRIRWFGNIPRLQVFEWYAKSILIFPSYIETVGLPIYEAMMVGSPLILANCQYARDVAAKEDRAHFFSANDARELAKLMKSEIKACRESP